MWITCTQVLKVAEGKEAVAEAKEEAKAKAAAARAELAALGGTAAYQEASALSTALNSTSRWVVRALRALGIASD